MWLSGWNIDLFCWGEVPSLPKHAVTFWGSPGTFVTSPPRTPQGPSDVTRRTKLGAVAVGLRLKTYPFAL